jgi:Transposase IS4
LILGSTVLINEIIVRFYSCLADTFKMPRKLIKQGYKIFALAQDGYVWHFQLALKQHRIAELEMVNKLTTTGLMVFQIAQLLPKFLNAYFAIYMDNYFTSILLFSMLQNENIGAVRTTWPLGINFLALLIVLHKKHSTKLE